VFQNSVVSELKDERQDWMIPTNSHVEFKPLLSTLHTTNHASCFELPGSPEAEIKFLEIGMLSCSDKEPGKFKNDKLLEPAKDALAAFDCKTYQ
jgi:hypothetical protein